jgi:beta-exotoxin I transport system permease protein
MTLTLVRKVLRDLRLPLLVIAVVLALFQFLWAKITERIVLQIVAELVNKYSIGIAILKAVVFQDTGKVMQAMMGGEGISIDHLADMLSVGYVHPLVITILCIWAIGRASGAIAGEVDRGTMELLLAQPLPRDRVVLAHLIVDLITIPVLCLSIWIGTWLGAWAFDMLDVTAGINAPKHVNPWLFGPGLVNAAALTFAVTGYTLWLSSAGRFRSRVMGAAVLITLVQYLVNLIGQMLTWFQPFRPFTIFYYYQPQQIILHGKWWQDLGDVWADGQPLVWVYPVVVLLLVGAVGYVMAFWTFSRRDLPAPL